MDRGNRYGGMGTRGGYSPTKKKNDGNRRPNNFQRSGNDGKDDRSEYLERYLGKFTGSMSKGVAGDSSSRTRDSREGKFVPRNEQRNEGHYGRDSRGGGESNFWKGQASGHMGGNNQAQRPQQDKRTPFNYSSSKPHSNVPRQNYQNDFSTPTMVPPPSHSPATGKMPSLQLSSFNKTFPVWESESKQMTKNTSNLQGSRFMPGEKSQNISSSNPMPVPAPSLSLLSGGPSDRGYSNLQSHIASFLPLQTGSSQLSLAQISDSNAARSFNASVPPPSVALPSMASLSLPSELGKSTPDGSGLWTYPAPELNSLTFDPATGLRFDAITGLHYDANSGYFYNYKLGLYLVYDVLKQTYIRAPVHAAGLGEQVMPAMMQPAGASVSQPLIVQTQIPAATPMAIQEPQRQSMSDLQNIMAAQQWNPQITPSPNNLALRAGNPMKRNQQYETRLDEMSDNDMDSDRRNQKMGRSMSGNPRRGVMNQRQDKKSFNESANRNQNFGRKAHEMKRSRSRSRSAEDRQRMNERSNRAYQETQPRNSAGDQYRERTFNYVGRPKILDKMAYSGSESRNKYNRNSGGRRSPPGGRMPPGEREDHQLSPDPRSSQGYSPRSTSPGPYAPGDALNNRRSPVNRPRVEERLIRHQNYDRGRQVDGQRANSSRPTNSSQERTFPEHRRQFDRCPSLERPLSRGSRRPRRGDDEEDMNSDEVQDKRNMVQERVKERRRTPSIENQASKNSRTLNARTVSHTSDGRANSPDSHSWQKGRRDEKTLENLRSSWPSRQERQHSPAAARVHSSRTKSKEIDSTCRPSPNYRSKPDTREHGDIEDYSEDVSALLLDQSSEMSMEMGDDASYAEREKARSRSKSEQRTYSRDHSRREITDRETHDGRQPSKTTGGRSCSRKRSVESHAALNQRRSRSIEATRPRRCAPNSPTSPSARRQGSRLRSEHRETETRPRSPPSRTDSQRGLHGSRKIGNSRRQSPGRDQKSPVRGRDVRQKSPPKRVSRSPLSRLGEVRQNVHRSSFERKQVKRRSPSTDRSDRRLPDRERRSSPARNVNKRHSPQGRRSPYEDRSGRRDVNARMRSPGSRRSPSDARSEKRKSPTPKPSLSPPGNRRNRREFSPSPQGRSQSHHTESRMSPSGSPLWIPDEDRSRFERNNSQSRVQSVKDFCSRLDKISPNREEFTGTRSTSRDSQDGNGSQAKRSDGRNPETREPETRKRLGESAEKIFEKDRHSQSRTPQKPDSRRSVSPQAKRLKLENKRRPPESVDKSDVIVLDSDDELGIGTPVVDEAPMTDDDVGVDDEEQHVSPSQSVGNLSVNSDELNYSASSVASEPFDEEDESWTVLDCVEGESDKESDHTTSEKNDDFKREKDRPSSSRLDDYKSGTSRSQPTKKHSLRKESRPLEEYHDDEEPPGLCKPVEGDRHSLAPFFEPNPTKFIAATYRMRNLPFKFVKNFLVEKCEDLDEDVKVIPCKRDVNAAPYDFITMIFPSASLAAEWYARYDGKIVTTFKRQTVEIFLYFHLGNWNCENCEAINFPLRSICYSCFKHKDGGYSPVKMLNSPSRFIAIYKLSMIHPKRVIEPFIKLFKRNPYKRLHAIRDPRTNYFSGICVIEMPNRVKGQSLFKWLPIEYKNESRCAYVKMVEPDETDEIGDVRMPAPLRKTYSSSKMPFQHFKDLSERAQLPKHRVPKPDGRGLLIYHPPDKEQFTFEPITQMFYDPVTGLYYHPRSDLFYNDDLHICLRWDAERCSYLYIDTTENE